MANKAVTIERYHRRKKRDKTLDAPKPRACTNPMCTSGWERRPGGYFCLECHGRVVERAEYHRR